MGLQTACPICHTVFKVDDKHLSSAQGMVQCGVCGMVFNAAQHLQTTQALIPPETQSKVAAEPSEDQIELVATTTEALAVNDDVSDVQQVANVSTSSSELAADGIQTESTASGIAEINEPEVLTPIQFRKSVSRNYKILYFFAAVLLTISLVLQFSIPYRHQIISSYPSLYLIFNTICGGQLCSMNAPYDLSQIELTNSSFEIDSKHKNLIKVTLSIQNNADIQLQYPRFALSLTDNEDNPVSIRKIYPYNYLNNTNKVLDPHEEQVIKLQISPLQKNVTGYKLRLF